MSAGIHLQSTCSHAALAESSEPQLLYILVEATAQGLPKALPKLPLNLCLVIDRSSSMRGERLQQVRDAALRIVEQMSREDYFSLVTFNDRADIVVSSQRVNNRTDINNKIMRIDAAGGTEMAAGLALALQEVRRAVVYSKVVNRILLLTDGRTYGDDSRCVQIARRAQDHSIGITALGIGHEWNEDLLETIAARENSRTQYIASATDIAQVFADEMKRMSSIFAQQVNLVIDTRPDLVIRSLDRVQPFIAPVAPSAEYENCWKGNLGDWPDGDVQTFLIEAQVPPLAASGQASSLLKLTLHYDLPGVNLTQQQSAMVVKTPVLPADQAPRDIHPTVKYWLERLVAYRLQSRAWEDLESGHIHDATQRLRMAGTRLLESGEVELAHTVEKEADRLLHSGHTTAEGRKQIKYGTRGLTKRT